MTRKNKSKASVAAAASVSIFAFGGVAQAAPSGGTVVKGGASITTPSGTETLINQTTAKAVINWNDFSIDAGELVKFMQQMGNNSVTLNRVTGSNISQIKGALTANGNIFLINPNGIVFGATASVDVAGLVASTFDIDPDKFMNGDPLSLTGDMMSNASISNAGKLKVGDGGFVYLIAPNVENTGHIIANVGTVTLASDGDYQVDLAGNGLIKFSVDADNLDGASSAIKNSGVIDGGGANAAQNVLLSGSQADAVVSSVVNTGDITAATELTMAGDTVEQSGTVAADSTTINADQAITSNGGSISGTNATLVAGGNIGTSSKAVNTGVDNLTVENGSGDAYVQEADSLNNLTVSSGGNAHVGTRHTETDPSDPTSTVTVDDSVDLAGDSLSTTGTVTGQVSVTDTNSGVTLDNADVSGDLSVTAAGNIVGAGNADGDAKADHLSLNTSVEGASVGTEGNALRIDADTLSASADKGHIVVSDTSGDLALDKVTTGDTGVDGALRAIITAEDGDLTGVAGAEPNVQAWATNLKADGNIGSAGQAVTTHVRVLSASTQDGGIHIDDSGDDLVLNTISAGERVTLDGKTVSVGAVSNADGDVTLANGAVGSHDVSISADQDILITNGIVATGDLNIDSRDGSLYQSGSNALLTGREIDLSAGGGIGQTSSGALKTQSNEINAAAADGGVYLQEAQGLNIGELSAAGDDNNVELSVSQGDMRLHHVKADGGSVSVSTSQGAIKGDGSALNVEAGSLTLDASKNIGTSGASLATKVNNLTTTTGTNLAGTYVANQGPLARLAVTTLDGDVTIQDTRNSGSLTFTGSTDTLSLSGSVQTEALGVTNNGGGLNVDGMDLSGQDVVLTASGAVTGRNGVLKAFQATLNAEDGIDLDTNVDQLDATTSHGDIDIDNSAHVGTLTATAEADDGDVTINEGGDLAVDGITASGDVSLTAGGAINGVSAGDDVQASNLTLFGNGIGGSADAFTTRVNGKLSADAGTGGLFLANVGSLTMLDGKADGDINLNVTGDAILDELKSGGDVVFSTTGRVSDGNGDDNNIQAGALTMDAQRIGARDGTVDALEMKVDELVLDTSNGGIYVRNLNSTPLTLTRAKAAGGDVSVATKGDLDLNTASAAGNKVTLTSDGAINDARPNGSSDANVLAKDLDMQARNGVGNTGPLTLDVDHLSVGGGSGGVNAANLGAVAVDSDSLEGKGTAGVTIVATSITILDDNGGVITLDGGSLNLTATNGNIVFLNQDDTIMLPGGGSITLTAKADPEHQGYNGNIISGNLTTDGGDITLDADANVTLGMLDTGGTGDVTVTAHNGVILDGNGADQNIRGDHVTLIANTPTLNDAEINRETAISDYAGRLAELKANTLQLENLQQQLNSYIGALQAAIVAKGIAQTQEDSTQREVDSLQRQLDVAQAVDNGLNTALNIAGVARNAVAIAAGAAQAIPFSGDAGADAAFAVVDLAFSVAQTALDSYERYSLDPLADNLTGKQIDLATLKANTRNAITSVDTYTNLRDALQVSVDNTTQAVFNTQVASDASEALRKQSISAYNQNQDIDMSASNPLGIQANQLDMGTGSGRALNSDVYLTSDGDLGLGDINADGVISAKGVTGDISVVGDVVSPSLITLQAGGAVRGTGGTWVGGVWTPSTGSLNAPTIAVRAAHGIATGSDPIYTDTDEIAAEGGDGDIYIENDNGGDELVLGTVDGVSGLKADGDLGLSNQGDLRLKTQVVDTDTDSDNNAYLVADGGGIIDDNGDTLNVTTHDLYFQAGGNVELDTDVDRVVDGDSTSQGDITLRNLGDLDIVDLAAAEGDMDVSATGGMVLETLAAGGVDGNITLDAQGNVDDDQDNDTRVSGHDLNITAAGSIGATGGDDKRALDTSVDSLTASAHGEVNLDDSDDLDVTRVATSTGDVTLTSQSGDLHLGEVRTDGDGNTITVQSAGAIDALNDADDTAELHGSNLALRAGSGIGRDDQSLLVETSALEADAGTGGLYITDRNNDLTVGGVTPNLGLAALSGLDADGDLRLDVTDGSLTVNEDVTQTGTGDTDLHSRGDMIVNAGMQADGDLQMQSGANITVNGQTLTADGNVTGLADGDMTLTSNSRIDAGHGLGLAAFGALSATDSTLNSGTAVAPGSGDIDDLLLVTQNGDITLTNTTGTAAGGIQVGAGSGTPGIQTFTAAPVTPPANVTLSNTSLDARGDDLALSATGDITLTQASSATAAEDLSAGAGGDITLEQSSSLSATAGRIDADAGNGIAMTDSAAQAGTSADFDADQADILIDNGSVMAGTDLSLGAGTDITLTNTNTDPGAGGGHLTARTGDLNLVAGDDITLDSASTGDAQGDVTASAGTGDLTLSQSSGFTAVDGNMDLDAGNRVGVTDSTLTAGTSMTVDAAADIALDNASASAGSDLAMTAKTDVGLDHASADATTGDLSITGTDGDVTLTDSTATAGSNLTSAAGADISLTDSHATATAGDIDLHAGNGISLTGSDAAAGAAMTATADVADILLDDSNATAATDLTLDAGGTITLTDTSGDGDGVGSTVAAQAGDLDLTAGDGIALDSASHGTGHGNLTANAESGDLTVIEQSTLLAATGKMDLDAGTGVTFTDSSANAATSMTVDATGAAITLNNSHATAGTDLSLDAGTDITLTDSADPATTGSTLVATTGNLSLDAGDHIALDSASSGTGHGDVTANAKTGDLTVIEQSSLLADTGEMDLDAGNRVAVTDSTLDAATDITVDATDADIALDNSDATAGDNLAFTAGTDVTLVNGASAEAGSGDLTATATAGDINLTDSTASADRNLAFTAGKGVALDHSSADATNAALAMTAQNGDVSLSNGSATSAGTTLDLSASDTVSLTDSDATSGDDMTLTGTAGDIIVNNGETATGGILDAHAGDNITLTDALAISGDHDPADPAPAREDAGMALTADQGEITLTRSQAQSGGDLTGSAGLDIGLTDSDATAAGAATLTAGTDQNGTGADIALDNSHITAAGSDATLTAADSIHLQRASTIVAHDNLSAEAQSGDLTLIERSSLAAQQGRMDLDAGNAVAFTDSSATAATSMTVDATDAGITLANSHATAGTDLSLDAGTDITLTDSADPATTGSTLVADGGDLSLDAGGNIALDSASSGVAQGDVTANAESGDLTVIEQSKLLARTGQMDLDAGNRVGVTDSTLDAATDMTVDATGADIALDNSHAIAGDNLAFTAGTDVTLVNGSHADATSGDLAMAGTAGDVALTDSVANAHGTLDLSAGKNIRLTRSNATSGDDMTLTGTAGDVTLGQSQVTTGADLTGKAGQNLGLTQSNATASGNVTLTAGTDQTNGTDADLTLDNSHVNANGGDAILTAADSIGLEGASTVVARDNLSADAQAGDLTLIENSLLNARTGSMDLDAGQGVAITDSTLVTATDLTMDADGADIVFENSHATAQSGDATLSAANNVSLARASTVVAHGDLSADAQAGDLTLAQSSLLAAQTGDLSLNAGDNIVLESASSGFASGDVTANAESGDLAVTENSSLTAATGKMDLDAANRVAVSDSVLSAATTMTVDAAAADIALSNSGATAGDDLSMTAATDVSLDQSGAQATSGDLALTGTAGDVTLTDSAAEAGRDLTATATSGDIKLTDSTASADRNLAFTAGKGVALDQSSADATNVALAMTAQNGDVTLSDGSATSAGTTLDLSASDTVSLTDSDATSGDDMTLTGTDGDIRVSNAGLVSGGSLTGDAGQDMTLTDSTATSIGKMDLQAGSGVALTGSDADAGAAMAVTAGGADILLDDSNATAATDLSLDADGSITLTDTSGDGDNVGSTVTAQTGDLGLTAGDNIALDSASHGVGHVDVTANAASGDLTVIEQSTLLAETGKMDLDAGTRVGVTDSTLGAATDLTLDAAGADIALNNSVVTAGNDLSLAAGTDVSLTDTAAQATAGDLAITANDGAITQSGSSTAVSAGDMALDASDGVTVTDLASGADLTVAGGQGGIDMAAGSLASAAGDLTMTTDGDINLTRAEAAGDVTLTSNEGGINASGAVSENVTGRNLFLSTAKSIGSALSGLKTKVATLYATITGSGDLYLDEADALTVKDAELADGDAHITAGDDLTLDRLAVNGDAMLDSAGVITTGAGGSVSADDLTATAVDGIDLNADLASASLDVTGPGDLNLVNAGALVLNRAITTDGDIQVDSGGDLGLGEMSAPGAHRVALSADGAINAAGAGRIDARDVALRATTGIGDQGLLSLNAATLTARSDNGDINLDQTGTVALNQVVTGDGAIDVLVHGGDAALGDIRADGDVSVNAVDGVLRNDHDGTTYVGGDTVTLASAGGVGESANAIDTRATRVNASVSGEGDINVKERDGLAGLNARASNGNIRVSTSSGDLTVDQVKALGPGNAVMLFAEGGAIRDGDTDANNIVASLLELDAGKGIGLASNPLDVRVDTLSANGGSGGVYINNDSRDPLDVLAMSGAGELVLNTRGNLDLSGALNGRGVAVRAGGDLNQHADINATNGVTVMGGGDVTMDQGTHTHAQGPIRYQAGNVLTVANLTTVTGLNGGRITLQGHDLESSEPGAGSIRGGQVQVLVPTVSAARVHHMVHTTHGKARVYLNGRTLGGKISEDSAYVQDLTAPTGFFPTVVYQALIRPWSLGFEKDDHSEEWHYNP